MLSFGLALVEAHGRINRKESYEYNNEKLSDIVLMKNNARKVIIVEMYSCGIVKFYRGDKIHGLGRGRQDPLSRTRQTRFTV